MRGRVCTVYVYRSQYKSEGLLGGLLLPFTGACQRGSQSYCSQGDLGLSGLSITKLYHRSKQAFSDSICQSSKPRVQGPSSTPCPL